MALRVAIVGVAALVGATALGCSPGSTAEYCTEAAAVVEDNPAGVFAAWNPADPTASADDLESAAGRLQALADAAPAEIEADLGMVADTAAELADVLTELSGAELTAALRELADVFADVDDASRRVTAFTRTECGVDLEAPPPSTTV